VCKSIIEAASLEMSGRDHSRHSDRRPTTSGLPREADKSVREEVAKRYRLIAYTQRYHGVGAWKDDGKEYSTPTHADDLAKFITSLNVGPVHLVGRSSGGRVAMTAALRNPALVRTLTLHEPEAPSVLPADSAEGKAAREDQAKFYSAAIEANKAGDPVRTTRLFVEGVYQLSVGRQKGL